MNTKQIAIRDCIECVRGKNSINGNPRYIFTFDDNTTVKTEANAGLNIPTVTRLITRLWRKTNETN